MITLTDVDLNANSSHHHAKKIAEISRLRSRAAGGLPVIYQHVVPEKWIERARDKGLELVENQTYSFYKTPPLKPLQHRKAHRIVSTLFELREELRAWRSLGIGSLVAFFGLTLSLLAFGANLYRQNADLNRQFVELHLAEQVFDADGEVAYADAGSVIDGGGKRRRNTSEPDLTYPARSVFV
jgi:hypothetical protein